MADLSPVPPAVPQQQPLSPVPPRRPSLDDVVFGAFGMDPTLKRATLLPVAMNAAGEREWAVPQAVVDMLSSAMLPGHVMKGGAWSPQDVTKMALDVGMLSTPVGAATAPAGALGMFAGKAAKTADHAALARAEAMEQATEVLDDAVTEAVEKGRVEGMGLLMPRSSCAGRSDQVDWTHSPLSLRPHPLARRLARSPFQPMTRALDPSIFL